MSVLALKATGVFTAATSWFLVHAGSRLDSEVNNTALTTAYVASANFIPGAITVDGIAIKLAARVASPTGTISVKLYNATDSADVKIVTINVADLPTCATGAEANEGGWIFFKFDASTLLIADKNYNVQAKCSVDSEATLYRNGTAGDWSRMLRTTTEQAPALNDLLNIIGEHTGAGTGNDFVVTMDNTATTAFGLTIIGKRGTLNYAYDAATAYYLKLTGNLIVYNGGTLTIGTVANPIPRNSTAVLEFNPGSDGEFGLIARNGSTFTAQGLSRTVDKLITRCKLNTDEAAGQTVLGVDADTGWLANDEIGIASTTRTYSQCEKRTLSAISATELTVSASITHAHSGTSPTQAEVILLTRNVKIRAAVSTLVSFVSIKPTATIDIDWVEFYWLGENVVGQRGIEIETTTGSCNIQYSSLHDFEDRGVYIVGSATNNITFSNNITYNLASLVAWYICIATTSGTAITFDNNIVMLSATATNYGFIMGDIGGTFTNNTVVGINGIGFFFKENGATIGTFNNNIAHSCAGAGISFYALTYGIVSNLTVWRNNSSGIQFEMPNTTQNNLTIDTATLFGNATSNIGFLFTYIAESAHNITFKNITSSGDVDFATVNGISWLTNGGHLYDIYLINCSFGVASGIKTAHTTDINLPTTIFSLIRLWLNNCILASGTEVAGLTSTSKWSFVKSQKHDQTAGLHKSWFKFGVIQTDTAIYRTAAPSARLTPNDASNKLESGSFKVNVNNGQTCTPSVYVYEAAAYNGSRCRLILKRNDAIGIMSDAVLDTRTGASDAVWELLTGTTAAASDNGVMEFVLDIDGNTGFCNLDDFSAVVT